MHALTTSNPILPAIAIGTVTGPEEKKELQARCMSGWVMNVEKRIFVSR